MGFANLWAGFGKPLGGWVFPVGFSLVFIFLKVRASCGSFFFEVFLRSFCLGFCWCF